MAFLKAEVLSAPSPPPPAKQVGAEFEGASGPRRRVLTALAAAGGGGAARGQARDPTLVVTVRYARDGYVESLGEYALTHGAPRIWKVDATSENFVAFA